MALLETSVTDSKKKSERQQAQCTIIYKYI